MASENSRFFEFITRQYFFWLTYVAYFCVSLVFYVLREVSVGTDTDNYINYFNRVLEGSYDSRYEPIFSIITVVSAHLSSSYQFYFAVLFFLLSFSYLYAADKFSKDVSLALIERCVLICLLLSLTVFSSWYFTAATNALRHGLSLSFLYVGLLGMFRRKYIYFFAFYIISIGFHYSAILLFPFLIIMFFFQARSLKYFALIFFVLAISYPLGINELLVKLLSDMLGLRVYEKIAGFVGDEARWVGFQWAFFLYSLFWLLLLFLMRLLVKLEYLEGYDFLTKLYMLLLMPYMVFGFGGFSNRYAFMGWLFIPILQSFCVVMLKVNLSYKILAAAVLLIVSLFFQMTRFGYWESLF